MTKQATPPLSFKEAVQQSKVKQPTQPGYSLSQWEKAFHSYGSETEDDRRLYDAGVWFADQLDQVREALKGFPDPPFAQDQLWRIYVAAVNREYAVSSNAVAEEYSTKAGSLITPGAMIDHRLPIGPGGYPVLLRAHIELLVSAIRYPMAQCPSSKISEEERVSSEIKMLQDIAIRINLAGLYDTLSDLWAECLWNGWSISKRDDIDLILPPKSTEFISRIIGQHRSDLLLLELTWRTIRFWKELPEEHRMSEARRLRIIKIDKHKKNIAFRLGSQKDTEFPLPTFLAEMAAEEMYWNDILLEPLPNMPSINIRTILSVWYVLASLGELLKSYIPSDTGVKRISKLLLFAPLFDTSSLKHVIGKATSLHFSKIETVVNLFMFNGTARQDPWFKPIVPISENKCTMIIPALTIPNLIRSIESWMKEGGLALGDRGAAFEQYVRASLNSSIAESDLLSESKLHSQALEVTDGHTSEELDFVWLVGSVMIVGEIKCSIYPANPIEFYNYFETLRGAAAQATRKAQFVKNNLGRVLSSLKIASDSLPESITVFPLVITNLHIGAGFSVDNVPICDTYILQSYIVGKQDFFVEVSANGRSNALHTEIFYHSKNDAELNLPSYLLNPPIFRILKKYLDYEVIELPKIETNKRRVAYARFYIRDPEPAR